MAILNIDPMVDCVFKALLGRIENEDLLVHFLNAVLDLREGSRIREATVLNPFNEKEFLNSKLTVVDIKATDELGRTFQLEAQCGSAGYLNDRMVFAWAQTHCRSLSSGEGYLNLRPTIAIWVLRDAILEEAKTSHLAFEIYDAKNNVVLSNHLAIHVLQLTNFEETCILETDKARWMNLFKNGQFLDGDHLPAGMDTPIFRKAVKVMGRFSQEELEQDLYERRRLAELWHRQLEADREQAHASIHELKEQLAANSKVMADKDAIIEQERQGRRAVSAAFEKEREGRLEFSSALRMERERGERLMQMLLKLGADPNQIP